jgi:carbonic anhydrase/acetyltransferase-like protein (isoleucine patch superfamily)
MIRGHAGVRPDVAESAYVAENASVIGSVVLDDESSVWFGAVIRADLASIHVGPRSNVQDNATLHCDTDCPVEIGADVTIGHNAIVHGATIGDGALVGMHATVLNGAQVGEGSIIGAGAVVKEHAVIPPRSLAVGVPARVVKSLDDGQVAASIENARWYAREAAEYCTEAQQG